MNMDEAQVLPFANGGRDTTGSLPKPPTQHTASFHSLTCRHQLAMSYGHKPGLTLDFMICNHCHMHATPQAGHRSCVRAYSNTTLQFRSMNEEVCHIHLELLKELKETEQCSTWILEISVVRFSFPLPHENLLVHQFRLFE